VAGSFVSLAIAIDRIDILAIQFVHENWRIKWARNHSPNLAKIIEAIEAFNPIWSM
jgi:NRPS condensation-like uncharacterized protein